MNDEAVPSRQSPDDIDPELLREVGRASVVQDLKALSRELVESSKNFQLAVLQQQEHQTQLWKKIARTGLFASSVLAVGLVGVIVVSLLNRDIAQDTNTIVKDLETQAVDIDALHRDLVEVRDFVRRVQADEGGLDPAIADALAAVSRIEHQLCGDTCPAP